MQCAPNVFTKLSVCQLLEIVNSDHQLHFIETLSLETEVYSQSFFYFLEQIFFFSFLRFICLLSI